MGLPCFKITHAEPVAVRRNTIYCTPVYNLGPASSTDKRGGAAFTRAAALAASSTDDIAKGSGWIPLVPRAALVAASTDDMAKGGGWTPLIPSCHGFSVAKVESRCF